METTEMIVQAGSMKSNPNDEWKNIMVSWSLKILSKTLKTHTLGDKCKRKWKDSKTNIYLVYCNLKYHKYWELKYFIMF